MQRNANPPRANARATFIFDPRIVNGIPTGGTLRPVRVAGRNVPTDRVITQIADELRRQVLRIIRPYRRQWSDARIRRTVEGTLQMSNMGDARHAHAEHVELRNLNSELIHQIFDRATGQGSNPELDLYEVEWTFNIHRNTLEVGRARFWKNTKIKGLLPFNWPVEDDRIVSCGIVAFTRALCLFDPNLKRKTNYGLKGSQGAWFRRLCVEIRDKVGITSESMTFQDVLDIVDESDYSEFRIVIVKPAMDNLSGFTKEGINYVLNNDFDVDKTIYIYHHDDEEGHYIAVNSIKELYKSVRSIYRRWCHRCLTSFKTRSTCRCIDGQEPLPPKPSKKKQCSECNEYYYWRGDKKNAHICYMTKCQYCQQYHSTVSEATDRCILYTDPERFMKYFEGDDIDISNTATEEKDYPVWKLFFWDIESQMV